jgi:hypothetical protein
VIQKIKNKRTKTSKKKEKEIFEKISPFKKDNLKSKKSGFIFEKKLLIILIKINKEVPLPIPFVSIKVENQIRRKEPVINSNPQNIYVENSAL